MPRAVLITTAFGMPRDNIIRLMIAADTYMHFNRQEHPVC